MRPRVFPAEDHQPVSLRQRDARRFNEAAGIPRGRHGPLRACLPKLMASMRPRVFPAEDQRQCQRQVTLMQASMRPRVFPAEDIHTWW